MQMKSLIGLLGVTGVMAFTQAQSISWMETGEDYVASAAYDVDDSGRFVVGELQHASGKSFPAFWYVGQSLFAVQWRPMQWGRARAISREGDVVVGEYMPSNSQYTSAFVWRFPLDPNYTFRDLASYVSLDGVGRTAWDVVTIQRGSQEVSIVVGSEIYGANQRIDRPARYEINWSTGQHSAQDLLGSAYPRELHFGVARAISADGQRIVGVYSSLGTRSHGFFYDGAMQFVSSGVSDTDIGFFDIADDARIVCATRFYGNIGRGMALFWDGVTLHVLRDISSYALGVSADGNRIVGSYIAPSGFRACMWDRHGTSVPRFIDLTDEYQSILNGSRLEYASAISSDGRYIVGVGYNAQRNRQEGYILDTRPSCRSNNGDIDANGCVDDADLLAVLFAFGQTGNNLGRVDTNCDEVVDDADLLTVLFNFGTGC